MNIKIYNAVSTKSTKTRQSRLGRLDPKSLAEQCANETELADLE